MEKLIEELILIISKEVEAFSLLLKTLNEKQRAIVEGAIEKLNKNVKDEGEITHQTKSLETQRIARTQELAKMLSLDNINPRLSVLIEKVEEKYAQRLSEQRDLLCSIIEKINDLNASNQFLLHYSLQLIENSMTLLLNGNEKLTTYRKDGKVKKESISQKVLDYNI